MSEVTLVFAGAADLAATGQVEARQANHTDRELTANIRKALMDDKGLSTYAHNVKVVSRAGIVTLKGPIRSQEEADYRGDGDGGRGQGDYATTLI